MKDRKVTSIQSLIFKNRGEDTSVRTTFKMNEEVYEAIKWLNEALGLSTKNVFELIYSNQELVLDFTPYIEIDYNDKSKKYIKKTFVISEGVKNWLNQASRIHSMPRDVILGRRIMAFKKTIESIREKETRLEVYAHKLISEYAEDGSDIFDKLREMLSEDNPIIHRFKLILSRIIMLEQEISEKINTENNQMQVDMNEKENTV